MPTDIDARIRANAQLAPLVDKAEALLQNVLDPYGDGVTVDWDVAADERGQPVVDLKLSDYAGSVSDHFTAEQLAKTEALEFRLARLRRELSQIGSGKQLQKVKELLAQLKED